MFVAVSSRTMAGAKIRIDAEVVQYADIIALRRQREQEREKAAAEAKMRADGTLERRRAEAREAIKAANLALARLHQEWALEEALAENPRRSEGMPPFRAVMKNQLRLDQIARRICKATGVRAHDLFGASRKHDLVLARHAFMYWASRRTTKSTPEIGRFLGGRDHSTIISGVNSYIDKRKAMGRTLRPAR